MIKVENKQLKTKKAFSMVTAIFVLIIMATVSSLIMNVTSKTVKATTLQYQKEQAQLLARSYTELAMLNLIYTDRNMNCITVLPQPGQAPIHFGAAGDDGYDITINVHYIGNNTLIPAACGAARITPGWINNNNGFPKTVSVVIDTYITYRDFDDPEHRDITFHKRTIQKL